MAHGVSHSIIKPGKQNGDATMVDHNLKLRKVRQESLIELCNKL